MKKINEMAKVDLPQNYKNPKDFLDQYVASFEKRMKKDFSSTAINSLKKSLDSTELSDDDSKKVIKLAIEKYSKKKEKVKDKDDKMAKNVKLAAKKASDVLKEEILKNAGISLNEKVDVYEIKKEKK